MGRTRSYPGDGIVIHFEARRCIHAAECVSHLPSVFDTESRPWIDASGDAAEQIAQVIQRCPSGALTYERTDGGPPESVPENLSEITIVKDGPLYLRGAVEIVDNDGRTLSVQPRVALCRCGASTNKPFCDNSHLAIGFSAAE